MYSLLERGGTSCCRRASAPAREQSSAPVVLVRRYFALLQALFEEITCRTSCTESPYWRVLSSSSPRLGSLAASCDEPSAPAPSLPRADADSATSTTGPAAPVLPARTTTRLAPPATRGRAAEVDPVPRRRPPPARRHLLSARLCHLRVPVVPLHRAPHSPSTLRRGRRADIAPPRPPPRARRATSSSSATRRSRASPTPSSTRGSSTGAAAASGWPTGEAAASSPARATTSARTRRRASPTRASRPTSRRSCSGAGALRRKRCRAARAASRRSGCSTMRRPGTHGRREGTLAGCSRSRATVLLASVARCVLHLLHDGERRLTQASLRAVQRPQARPRAPLLVMSTLRPQDGPSLSLARWRLRCASSLPLSSADPDARASLTSRNTLLRLAGLG